MKIFPFERSGDLMTVTARVWGSHRWNSASTDAMLDPSDGRGGPAPRFEWGLPATHAEVRYPS
jgi:hypothetical protein